MSGPKTNGNGEIVVAKKEGNGTAPTLATLLDKMKSEIARAVPKHVNPDRMARVALTALRTTPGLAETDAASFAGSIMSCAQLGLEPNTPLGHAYLIPRWSNKRKCTEATLLLGYQGMIALARRSGEVGAIYAYVVREGDDFAWSLGLNPDVRHVPSDDPAREEKPITHAYAVAKLKNEDGTPGDSVFVVLTRPQIDARRGRGGGSDKDKYGPWVTDYESMALKTAVRALWRWLPKSTEMARAEALEEAPEAGKSQVAAWDPAVTDALARKGLVTEAEIVAAETIDPTTGEVSDANEDAAQ
jgi:recombination protein RecT